MKNLDGKNKNIVAIVGSLLIAIGAFLPFMKISLLGFSRALSISQTKYLWVFLVLAVFGFIAGWADLSWVMVLSGAGSLGAVFLVYSYVLSTTDTGHEITNAIASSLIQRDAGFYVMIFGSIVLSLSVFFRKKD